MKKNIEGFMLLKGNAEDIRHSIEYLKNEEVSLLNSNNDETEYVVKVNMEKTRFDAFWEYNVKNGLLTKSVIKGM